MNIFDDNFLPYILTRILWIAQAESDEDKC